MAATIDRNISDRAYYEVGSEVLFEETGFWDADNGVWIIQPADLHSRAVDEDGEPMLEQFARLWSDSDAHFVPPGRTQAETINVYGVDPIPFAKTVWWREDFAPYHINSMMNALAGDERALLADRSYFADQLLLRQGDPLTIRFAQLDIEFFIAGWIDDFPTHYPESGTVRGRQSGLHPPQHRGRAPGTSSEFRPKGWRSRTLPKNSGNCGSTFCVTT